MEGPPAGVLAPLFMDWGLLGEWTGGSGFLTTVV